MALRHLLPKRPAWLLATVVISVAAVATYFIIAWRGAWTPGRPAGLVFGTAAAVLVFLAGLYPFRRRLIRWPLTNSERWLQFHVYGGGLACVFVAVHVGFSWPVGRLGWIMILTGAWCAVSGVVGVILQKQLPAALGTELSVEATYERLPELAARLQGEADQLMTGASEVLDRVYQRDIRATLPALQPSWSYLVEVGSAARRLAPLRGLQAFVSEAEQTRLDDLAAIVSEKFQLDVQYSLQRVLRHWLILHVPITYLFLGLLVLHVVLVLSF